MLFQLEQDALENLTRIQAAKGTSDVITQFRDFKDKDLPRERKRKREDKIRTRRDDRGRV